jgi:gliding motility-associated-like protein
MIKLYRFFSNCGVLVLTACMFNSYIAQAQTTTAHSTFNAEGLWKSYDHTAFHKSLQHDLNLSNDEYDAYQKYLILQKKNAKDMIDFFDGAREGSINPANVNAWFAHLRNTYISYYPSFVVYSDSLMKAAKTTHKTNPAPLACGSPCTNPGFETGDFTAWIQQDGSSVSGTGVSGFSLAPGTTQTFISTPGPDPVVGATIPMVFPGGNFSARIGDGTNVGSMAGALSTSFTVSATTTNFTYAYAVVLQDGGHSASDQPYFNLQLTDQAGNVLACGAYEASAGPNIPNFYQVPGTFDVWYRPWTSVFVDLTPYIGQCVTLTFMCRDCDQGGHYGYAYVDASCAPAQIVTSSPAICGSSTITLTGPAGASGYSWSGPGIVGSNTGQTISVNVAGTYTVVMTSSLGGCTTTLKITVPGNPSSPTANFTSVPVCAKSPMQFTDQSKPTGQITAWAWDFNGDGVTDATTQNPTYTFPAAGTYPVHLTITWPPCTHDTIINVVVNSTPAPSFTSTSVCAGTPTSFTTGTVATSYLWALGDGTTSTSQNPFHSYTTSGTYTATLTVTGAGGCKSDTSEVVTVIASPTSAFTAPAVCLNTTTVFANSSINGSTYSWDFADGTTSTLQNPTHTYGTAGTFTVSLISTATGGCTNTVKVPVVVYGPPEAAFHNTSVCLNSATVFTDSSSVGGVQVLSTWSWDFGDGTNSTAMNPSHTYTSAGTYTAQLITSTNQNCLDTAQRLITIYAPPQVTFAGDTLLHCNPWCVNFRDTTSGAAGSISKWVWNFGDNTPPLAQTVWGVANHCYPKAGTYDVTLTVKSNHGCVSTLLKPAYVTIYPSPEAAFTSTSPATVLEPSVSFTDQSTNAVGWHWTFGDKGDTLGNTTPSPGHIYPSDVPATYTATLIVTSSHGCTDTIAEPVIIGPVFDFYAPNCFTPNADGKNDLFFGYGVGIDKYNLMILDRWGNLLFQTDDLYTGWDGKVQNTSGQISQNDVYVWKVKLTDVFGKPHSYIGHVSLIR